MYTARAIGGREYRFRKLDALAKRLGGNDYQVEHETSFSPPVRQLLILRRDKFGTHVVTRVRVPAEALD